MQCGLRLQFQMLLTPVKNEDSILVDGGVVNNIPINHAQRMDNDLLVAVNVNADIPLPKKKKKKEEQPSFYQSTIDKFSKQLSELFSDKKDNDFSYFDIMSTSFELMRNEMVKFSLKDNPPDILIETSRKSCNIYDFYKAEELIEIGHEAAISAIKNYTDKS